MGHWPGKANADLDVMTQINVRFHIFPLTKIYQTDTLSHKLSRLSVKLYTDTIFSVDTYVKDNKCSQLYTDGGIFSHALTMMSKYGAGESLVNVVKDIGIMNEIHCNNALEQVGMNAWFMSKAGKYNSCVFTTDPYSSCQNNAEDQIRIINNKEHMNMARHWVHKRLFYFELVWEEDIYYRNSSAYGLTGIERRTGETPDISNWTDFYFLDMVWYWQGG